MPRSKAKKNQSSLASKRTSTVATAQKVRSQKSQFSTRGPLSKPSGAVGYTANVASSMKSQYKFYFNTLADLGLEIQIPLFKVVRPAVSAWHRLVNANNNFLDWGLLSPTSPDYLDLTIYYLASMFSRYKLVSMEFIYSPQTTTTVTDTLRFGFSNNVKAPAITTASDAALNALLSEKYSQSFAPWEGWTMKIDQQDLSSRSGEYYTNQPGTLNSAGVLEQIAENLGVFTIRGGSDVDPIPTSDMNYGILWARMRLNLFDLGPIVAALLTPDPEALDLSRYSYVPGKGFACTDGKYCSVWSLRRRISQRSFGFIPALMPHREDIFKTQMRLAETERSLAFARSRGLEPPRPAIEPLDDSYEVVDRKKEDADEDNAPTDRVTSSVDVETQRSLARKVIIEHAALLQSLEEKSRQATT